MKKIIIGLIGFFFAFSINAQVPAGLPSPNSVGFAKYSYLRTDSASIAALRDTLWNPKYVGSWVYYQNGTDSAFYVFNGRTTGKKWDRVVMMSQGSGGYVLYTDTANMLSGYQHYNVNTTLLGNTTTGSGSTIVLNGSPTLITPSIAAINVSGGIASLPTGSGTLMYRGDTTSLSNRINAKLNLSDTAVMLTPYRLEDIAQDSALTHKLNKSDTASMLTPYHAAYYSSSFDTSSRVLTLNPIIGTPTTVIIPRGSASGATGISVLSSSRIGNLASVSGDNGSITYFSINSTDSSTRVHFSDSSTTGFTTWLLTKKKVDSLGAIISTKLSISDTASMMSGYRRNSVNITNANLVNSTISGVPLGSNLNGLTPSYGINGSIYNGSSAISNWKVDTTSISTKANVDALLLSKASKAYVDSPWVDIQRQGVLNQTETTISFDGVNTFTITPVGSTWNYYRDGIRYTITGSKSVTLSATPPAATGTYYIYIDDNIGTLTASTTAWTLLDSKLPIAAVNWNNTSTPKYWFSDERHSVLIDKRMGYYLHATTGSQAVTIPTLAGYTTNSTVDANKTFSITASSILDQDIKHDLSALAKPTGTSTDYVSWYRTAASTYVWKLNDMPFLYATVGTSNTYIQWDNNGTATAGTTGRYYNSYLLVTSKNNASNPQAASRYVIIAGRGDYASLATAQAESVATFDWTGFPIEEAVVAYRLTWLTNSATTTKGKCVLAAAPQIINISAVTNTSSGAGTDHNTLANLQGGIASNEYYHLSQAEHDSIPYMIQRKDTATMLSGYTRDSDTSLMLSPYAKNFQLASYVPITRTLTINGTGFDLSANRTWNVGTVTSVATDATLTGGTITSNGTLKVDTTVISTKAFTLAGISDKLSKSDTASMLSPYAKNFQLSSYKLLADSGFTTGYTTRATTKKVVDSLAALISAMGGGTVLSVATNNASGITGGTITSSGTISADTSILSTRLRVQKGIDSLGAIVGTKGVGSVTSVAASAGTGISVSGSPITSSGTITITNTAPDQTVVLTAGTGISTSGTYPNFTITNTSPSSGGTVTSVATNTGSGITGGTITSSGTIAADTSTLATRLRVQKGIDSLGAIVGTKGSGTVTNVSALTLGTTGTDLSSSVATGTTTPVITLNVPTASASNRGALSSTDWSTFNGKQSALSGSGLVKSTSGTITYITDNSGNWDAAYTQRLQWDGGSTNLVAATGRTSLGATTVGGNFFTLTNPSAISFPRINADNTVSTLDAASFRSAIGAGTSSTTGTVTSVAMTVPTGLSISGSPITSSGTLAVSLTTGYSIPTTSDQSSWTTAYNKILTTAALSSSTLTLTLNDASTVTASVPTFNQNTTGQSGSVANSHSVGWGLSGSSFNGSSAQSWIVDTAAYKVATKTDLNIYTGRTSITTLGTIATGVWNGTAIGDTYISSATNWNTAYTNRITSATAPISIAANSISISQATTSTNGYLSSTDWNTFNGKASSTATFTLGSTSIALGSTTTTVAGLSSVTSTTFVGALTGTASGNLALTGGTLSGNLIGQTAQFTKVFIQGDAANNLGELDLTNTGTSGKAWRIGDGIAVSNGTLAIYNTTSSSLAMSLTSAGLLTAASFTGTINTAAQPNITSVGTLTSLTVSGNSSITGADRVLELRGAGSGANSLLRYSDGANAKFSTGFNGGNYIIYDDVNLAYRFRIDGASGTINIGQWNASTIGVAYGGTGNTTLTSNYLYKGQGTSAMVASALYESGGKVGIGTNAPATTVEISNSGSRGFYITPALGTYGIYNSAIGFGGYFDHSTGANFILPSGRTTTGAGGMSGQYDGSLSFYAYDYGSTAATSVSEGTIERMRINAGGNVGIGTTANTYKLDVNGTGNFSGALSGTSATFSGSVTSPQFASTVQTLTDGATVTFNAANGSNAVVTLGGNRTLAWSNTVAGTYYTLRVIQDATGSRTLTLPSGSKVIGGGSGAITLSTAAGSVDLVTFYYDGTNYYVTYGTNYN